jgi:hypothetical protein
VLEVRFWINQNSGFYTWVFLEMDQDVLQGFGIKTKRQKESKLINRSRAMNLPSCKDTNKKHYMMIG